MKRVGVALGAGGARGLAHIVVLEAFEELGIRPTVISGTSIGAVIGVAFAAGLSTTEMKEAVDEIRATKPGRFGRFYSNSELNFVLAWLDPTVKIGGLIKGEKFLKFLSNKIRVTKFDQLSIPFMVVATDFRKREQVVFDRGDVLKAVQASYSMPGLFAPVSIGNGIFVDGGLVNPLPYDVIRPFCDITVAVDVAIHSIDEHSVSPRAQEVLFSAFQIMQNSVVREKLVQSKPDIHITIDVKNVRSLEFNKTENIFQQALDSKEELKRKLLPLLG
jgi:NTE family protein